MSTTSLTSATQKNSLQNNKLRTMHARQNPTSNRYPLFKVVLALGMKFMYENSSVQAYEVSSPSIRQWLISSNTNNTNSTTGNDGGGFDISLAEKIVGSIILCFVIAAIYYILVRGERNDRERESQNQLRGYSQI